MSDSVLAAKKSHVSTWLLSDIGYLVQGYFLGGLGRVIQLINRQRGINNNAV